MGNHEEMARELRKKGHNCSSSLNNAFIQDTSISIEFPAPRSIEGKCGALLTACKILKETGHEDKVADFEKEFEKRFKYTKCIELMTYERRCDDYVGESAKIIDEIIK